MNLLNPDLDVAYARGELSREEWLRRRRTSCRSRNNWLFLVLVAVVAIAALVALLAGSGAVLPKGITGVSYEAPARLSPTALDHVNGSATAGRADSSNDSIWYPSGSVTIVFHASPSTHDLTFVVQGLVNPTLHFAAGARVTAIVVNEDPDMYHNWALSHEGPPFGGMPMMGMGMMMDSAMLDPSSANGFWSQEFSFAAEAGQYWYLCSYPGHAADGMYGTFVAG